MALYHLYLESGPKKKKTMVHVLDLLGCIALGSTTEEALERTPQAIQSFLHFLQKHGANADSTTEVQTQIMEHITEGQWPGNGDPSITFQPDLLPLPEEAMEEYIQRLEWIRLDVLSLISGLSEEKWLEKPAHGRSIRAIVEHIFESEYAYMMAFGKLEGVRGAGSYAKMQKDELLRWMAEVRKHEIEKLRSLTEQQRSELFIHWKQTRTARKVIRRMLEHEWEHLTELEKRLVQPA